MLHLENETLRAVILDPAADRKRLGPRFCTGGYIYQVEDHRKGPLLSGPEFPVPAPSTINGQGLPEVFQFTFYNREDEIPDKKLIIGVGIVENEAGMTAVQTHFHTHVEEFCSWKVKADSRLVAMETAQELLPWSLALTREIRLQELTITSTTRLSNTGSGMLPFRWFAHPFFPLLRNGHCCRFSPPFPIAENPGFALNSRGIVSMKSTHRWQDGHFQEIEEARGHTLGALQYHPLIPGIEVKGDFPLHRLALWANDKTFSFEPFCAGSLNPGETTVWSIQYRFGHREA